MNAFGTKRATREKCLGCGALRTPGKVRWQYKRAIRHRLTPDEAKALMPRCQKCLTKALGYEHHHDGGLHTHADVLGRSGTRWHAVQSRVKYIITPFPESV